VPDALRDLLTRSAEGNPFYMEELVKMLIDQGAIEARWAAKPLGACTPSACSRDPGAAHADRRAAGAAGRAAAGREAALQQASVVGTVFWDQALAAVEARAAEQLPALVRRELTLPRVDAALDGLREYAFHHQLLHQVTYDTVLKRDKREGHARVARGWPG
jgi:predicted ATPase